MNGNGSLLSLDDLVIHYPGRTTGWPLAREQLPVRAVDGVSLEIQPGEIAGLVGESGCGKSTIALGVLRLVPITGGRVLFEGQDVMSLQKGPLHAFRRQAQIVFQDPYSSLHPKKRIEKILSEPFELHTKLNRSERRAAVADLLSQVGLRPEHAKRYARELSGGQRQRVAIARAISLKPRFIVLDEPLSALDVSIRAQVLDLLRRLQHDLGLTYIFISHDLATVRGLCDSLAVMYLGKIVESGPTAEIFAAPSHPYTRALISAIPVPDPEIEARRARFTLSGELPSAVTPPSGCRFRTRCPIAQPVCAEVEPPLEPVGPASRAACHFREDVRRWKLDIVPGHDNGRRPVESASGDRVPGPDGLHSRQSAAKLSTGDTEG